MNLTGLSHSRTARLLVIGFSFIVVAAVPGVSSSKEPPRHLLKIALSGSGKVTSTPKGIFCRSRCKCRFKAGSSVTLTAKPSANWTFKKWTGACAKKKGRKCTLRMNGARSTRAVFHIKASSPRSQPQPDSTPTPHCQRTLSVDTQKILGYLTRLSNDTEPGVIVGQNCRPYWYICDETQYHNAIGKLHDQSGRWPGILSLAYEDWHPQSPGELASANQQLSIPHWQTGGLLMISAAPVNPWGDPNNPVFPDTSTKFPGADLRALLPGGSKRDRWLETLERLANPLAQLRDAGVVVLWRPMQEMNDTWYWWSKRDDSEYHQAYVELWRDMFDYFTCVKRLDNLLWVFAPGGRSPALTSWPYPGDEYVDVIAPTTYTNDLTMPTYEYAVGLGKPLGISEYGPSTNSSFVVDGSFDDRLYAERLSNDYPRAAFFVSWNSWEGVKMSLADNLYASELMNDPRVLTRDEIAWD